ncbi:hypothetical protein [Nocardia sp. NPDC004722]
MPQVTENKSRDDEQPDPDRRRWYERPAGIMLLHVAGGLMTTCIVAGLAGNAQVDCQYSTSTETWSCTATWSDA